MEGTIDTQITVWQARWDGPHWRWWALAAGFGLVLASAALSALVSVILGDPFMGLWTFSLLAVLFVLSLIGSGMLSGSSRRMSRGGLARETATIDTDHRPTEERDAEKERDREIQDRRTIRMGIMALPVFVTFVYLLVG